MNNKRTLLTSWCRCPLGRLVAILVRIMISHVFVSFRKLFKFTLFWSTRCWLANVQLPAECSCWQSQDVMLQNDSCPWFELKTTSPVKDGNHNSEDVCFYFVCWWKHNCHSLSPLSVLRELLWHVNFLGVESIKCYLYCIISYLMVWYGILFCGMVWYDMVSYGILWYCIAWYGMVSYPIVLHPIVLYPILSLC